MRPFFIIILCILSAPALAQVAVVDDVEDEHIFTLNELTYFIDPSDTLTIETVASDSFARKFLLHDSYQNTDYQADAAYWIRMPVRYNSLSEKVWLFEFYDQTIDHLEAFVPLQTGEYRQSITGDRYKFERRTFLHKNFEFQLPNHGDTTVYYYFKIRSHDFADIRIVFRSVDRFIYYVINEYFLYGTFYGMILIISLYNFLVYLAIREVKHIYYIFLHFKCCALCHEPGWNRFSVPLA